ncbi:precorrin-3B C(17)-methyltransferase [Aphanothece sacrum]|uniref:Precorrin-3B C17-methyltransferase n=1 Tax=Aphanothece sacrum FPU1 TaxID=1920663 RepID=A0A401IDC3_APHSA|nr:precorrin-3B C(17)-methyltransferase [Aphanothece sacrum]GBF79275.1 precorrin-3B C17-methyltransferase [Aphanothece sacrum FPU1]GBF86778.1 precorrin-3B C17-methyltransferase [Aphanothece sacrum FPU3]
MSIFASFSPIAAIATTSPAISILQPLCQTIGATLYIKDSLIPLENTHAYQGSLKDHLATIWEQNNAFIFCLAMGAVVRLIATLLGHKSTDPAIIVVDPSGQFVISLCSGHEGGADRLTQLIAHQLNATPIITSASTNLSIPGIDILGKPFGWVKGPGNWTAVSHAIACGETVQVIQESGSTLWQHNLPESHSFYFGWPEISEEINPKARIWISSTLRRFSPDSDLPKIQWYPRVLWVGIGCIRGTSQSLIEKAIKQVYQQYHLATESIAGIATIDIKADEIGLVKYCEVKELPLLTFSGDVLKMVEVPNPSDVVKQEVGTPSVAEAAAIYAATIKSSESVSSLPSLLVPKQIIKSEEEIGTVTVAIAKSNIEYTGKIGQLYLVGMGPGSLDQITPAAKTAITQADAIIGYSLYLDLIKPLKRPGQIIEALPITQERKRAQRAIELAQWGLTVAVISSGDCGIYGMGGLVLEELQNQGWDGNIPQIEVFPGITALQAAAARVGTPLMHDFCAISLSDLLTPWTVIEKRLEAAAKGDFVTAIYNPRSQTRTEQISHAQRIFLAYRNETTPIALVRSAYRKDEKIILTNLTEMLNFTIDMLTIVLIGNSSTRHYEQWMITPRGYLGFD